MPPQILHLLHHAVGNARGRWAQPAAMAPARLLLFVLLLTWAVSAAAFAPRPACVGELMRPTGPGAGASPRDGDGDGEDGALERGR